MRIYTAFIVLAACASPAKPATTVSAPPARSVGAATPVEAAKPAPTPLEPPPERVAQDTPRTTVAGNTFIAPAGWTLRVRATGTVLESPEGGSFIALYDLADAKDADAAIAQAWSLYKGKAPYALINSAAAADTDGWSKMRGYGYDVPPNLKRAVGANVRFANGVWTAVILDMAKAVAEKRGAQVGLIFGKLLPKGYERESFAGKKAHPLDAARIAALDEVRRGRREGARRARRRRSASCRTARSCSPAASACASSASRRRSTATRCFMIASNTKALTTLMLAKLVDEDKLDLGHAGHARCLPSFKLGDADTTQQVLVKHLICACTGLPRQDLEWLLRVQGRHAAKARSARSARCSRPASSARCSSTRTRSPRAAGFIGGHVAVPRARARRGVRRGDADAACSARSA